MKCGGPACPAPFFRLSGAFRCAPRRAAAPQPALPGALRAGMAAAGPRPRLQQPGQCGMCTANVGQQGAPRQRRLPGAHRCRRRRAPPRPAG